MRNFFDIPVAYAGVITDAPGISSILANILKFLLSIAGIIAIIGLVIAGVIYLAAAGDMQRIALAKKAMLASIIGIVVVLGALVIVSQLTAFFS